MLNCILGMVDKTKRALAILQQRQQQPQVPADLGDSPAAAVGRFRAQSENGTAGAGSAAAAVAAGRRPLTAAAASLSSQQTMNELLAATLRNTEERVIEVRRRAEEAVQEVSYVYKSMVIQHSPFIFSLR